MEFFQVIRSRHSVRAFTPQRIESSKQSAILEAANRAPSAGNLQSFEIYAVTRATTKEKLRQAGGGDEFIECAPLVLVFCANPTRSTPRYGDRGLGLYSIQDATIACAYAQLAAAALGLGCVWVGAFEEDAVRRAIGAGEELRPVAMLPIGYPAEDPPLRSRRSLESLVHNVA